MIGDKYKHNCSLGSWITLAHPAIAEIMASSGFDWLTVDMEHSVITIREAEELIRIIRLSGLDAYVRLTANDSNQIKRVMDAGATGVIVPMVKTAKEAHDAVSAVKYPPFGTRGVGLARAQGYGSNFEDYKAWLPSNSKVIVQIEHIESVNNLDEIFSVEGVDGFIIGPYDLSGSMGIPGDFTSPEFLEALDQIETIARNRPLYKGIHIIEPDEQQLIKRIDEGFDFIAYSLDIRMLDVSCRSCIKALESQEEKLEY